MYGIIQGGQLRASTQGIKTSTLDSADRLNVESIYSTECTVDKEGEIIIRAHISDVGLIVR